MDAGPPTPEETVRAFAAAWSRLDLAKVVDLLRFDIEYHNIPLDPLSGKDRVETYLRSTAQFETCNWHLRTVAVAGCNVLTERVDEMVVKGQRIVLPVMGIFAVDRGLIFEWRDYFDLASYRAQWPDEGVQ